MPSVSLQSPLFSALLSTRNCYISVILSVKISLLSTYGSELVDALKEEESELCRLSPSTGQHPAPSLSLPQSLSAPAWDTLLPDSRGLHSEYDLTQQTELTCNNKYINQQTEHQGRFMPTLCCSFCRGRQLSTSDLISWSNPDPSRSISDR